MLTPNTKTKGVLFVIPEEDRKENGPVLSGNFANGDKTVGLSAFLDMSEETGRRFYNLSLGDKDGTHWYGRLFRNENKKSDKSPDYSGFMIVLPVEAPVADESGKAKAKAKAKPQYTPEDWEQAPKLTVFGRRVRSADNSARIVLDVLPVRSQDPISDEDVPL
jgi:hypothetical protein